MILFYVHILISQLHLTNIIYKQHTIGMLNGYKI